MSDVKISVGGAIEDEAGHRFVAALMQDGIARYGAIIKAAGIQSE
jgi:hypothetical protein